MKTSDRREIEIVACKECAKKELKEKSATVNDYVGVFLVDPARCKSKYHGRNK